MSQQPQQTLDNLQILIQDTLTRLNQEQGSVSAQLQRALLPLVTLFLVHLLYLGIRYLSRVERRLASHHHRSRTPSRRRSLSHSR